MYFWLFNQRAIVFSNNKFLLPHPWVPRITFHFATLWHTTLFTGLRKSPHSWFILLNLLHFQWLFHYDQEKAKKCINKKKNKKNPGKCKKTTLQKCWETTKFPAWQCCRGQCSGLAQLREVTTQQKAWEREREGPLCQVCTFAHFSFYKPKS